MQFRSILVATLALLPALGAAAGTETPPVGEQPAATVAVTRATNDTAPATPSDTDAPSQPPAAASATAPVDPATTASADGEPHALPVSEIAAAPRLPQAIDLTKTPDDLFVRIRNGFAMPNLNDDLVLVQQQWYLNRPDYLRRMVDRSARYLHYIVEELERRGMPTELALLPMVESAYNPMAYSRSRASGIWQFIPSTGKNFNLKQDWWVDERRDILAATDAALDYLQSIYEMHGDWFLALASYNWGEGAVARAIRKNEAKGLPTDYQSLTMPGETRNYVPKLQALKNIFSNRQLLAQLDLPSVPNRPYFATVTPGANIDIKVAAKLAEMPVDEFVALNPSHNRPVIQSETTLVIPAEKLETFQANLESHQEDDKPLSKWRTYTLRSGERLERLASRFRISLNDLKRINGISGRKRPHPGQTLLVPADEHVGISDMQALPEQPKQREAAPQREQRTTRTMLVRKGDTLYAIAQRSGSSIEDLRRINGLRGDRIAPGQRLKLAGPESTAPPAAARKGPRITRYTVKRGDTLYSIARQFKVDPQDLMRWNSARSSAIHPGQQLTIQLAQND